MEKQKRVRSARFVVPNNEQAVISIGAEKVKGTLHLLSLTGGTVRLQKRFASGTFADIGIETASGTFSAAIELLRMTGGNTQAFRFIAMGAVARGRLNEGLNRMRAQGLAIKKTPLDQFRSLARRVLSPRAAK
ncbi:MAG: PilZ domain-containing protein [Acidobacteriia bacterium]|nr:PilZ domain-containing protein [Terriglobia bacterium]